MEASNFLLIGLELIAIVYLALHYHEVKMLQKQRENSIDPKEIRALEAAIDDVYSDLMDRIDGLGVIKARNKSRDARAAPEQGSSSPFLSPAEVSRYQRGGK